MKGDGTRSTSSVTYRRETSEQVVSGPQFEEREEDDMKHRIASRGLVGLFAIALVASIAVPAHADDDHCSLKRAAGKWSFTDSGTVVGVGPRVAVGILTLDSAGNVSNGVATSSLNGSVAQETFSGTYTVNPDCTGTITVTISSAGVELFVVNLNSSFDGDMKHIRAIFTSVVEPNGTSLSTVIALDGNKQ